MTELFKGLEEARNDFNEWQGDSVLFIDFEDMTAWTNVGDIPTYHNAGKTIFQLVSKGDFYDKDNKYSKSELNERAEDAIKLFNEGYILKLTNGYY